jgi:hypothetical protein
MAPAPVIVNQQAAAIGVRLCVHADVKLLPKPRFLPGFLRPSYKKLGPEIFFSILSEPKEIPADQGYAIREGELQLTTWQQDQDPKQKFKLNADIAFRVEMSPELKKLVLEQLKKSQPSGTPTEGDEPAATGPDIAQVFDSMNHIPFEWENKKANDIDAAQYSGIATLVSILSDPKTPPETIKTIVGLIVGQGMGKILPNNVIKTMDPKLLQKIVLIQGIEPYIPPPSESDGQPLQKMVVEIEVAFKENLNPLQLAQIYMKMNSYKSAAEKVIKLKKQVKAGTVKVDDPKFKATYKKAKEKQAATKKDLNTVFIKSLDKILITLTPASGLPPVTSTAPTAP